MIKQIKMILIGLILCCCSSIFGQDVSEMGKLNVITGLKNPMILVGDQVFMTDNLINHELKAGSYMIKVIYKDEVVHSKVVVINPTETETVDASYQPAVKIVPKVYKKKQLKKIKKERGNFAIGLQFQSISGLSLKKYFGRHGFQVVGWHGGEDEDNISNDFGEKDEDYGVNFRYILKLKENLSFIGLPFNVYTGVGYGVHTYESMYDSDLDVWSSDYDLETIIQEVFIGVEYDTFMGSHTFGVSFRQKDISGTRYSGSFFNSSARAFEVDDSESGMLLNYGYHFYF